MSTTTGLHYSPNLSNHASTWIYIIIHIKKTRLGSILDTACCDRRTAWVQSSFSLLSTNKYYIQHDEAPIESLTLPAKRHPKQLFNRWALEVAISCAMPWAAECIGDEADIDENCSVLDGATPGGKAATGSPRCLHRRAEEDIGNN